MARQSSKGGMGLRREEGKARGGSTEDRWVGRAARIGVEWERGEEGVAKEMGCPLPTKSFQVLTSLSLL